MAAFLSRGWWVEKEETCRKSSIAVDADLPSAVTPAVNFTWFNATFSLCGHMAIWADHVTHRVTWQFVIAEDANLFKMNMRTGFRIYSTVHKLCAWFGCNLPCCDYIYIYNHIYIVSSYSSGISNWQSYDCPNPSYRSGCKLDHNQTTILQNTRTSKPYQAYDNFFSAMELFKEVIKFIYLGLLFFTNFYIT